MRIESVFCNAHNKLKIAFIVALILKIILLGVFSSDYQNLLFIPFIDSFIQGQSNPWEYVFENNLPYEFPYHPLMLYIFSISALIIKWLHIENVFFVNLIFKLPILFADLTIFYLLLKTFKNNFKNIFIYYFLSPVIIYAAYIHSQLDLVPVAFLFLSFYYLKKKKIFQGSFVFALACSIKTNAMLFFPIFAAYSIKNNNKRKTILGSIMIAAIYFAFSIPYIFSKGYRELVLFNEKINLLFSLYIPVGNLCIYISLFAATLLYLRFFAYKKINNELLDLYCVLVISLFLLFVPHSTPAWFIWIVPFLSVFAISHYQKNKNITYSIMLLNIVYLAYFVFLHKGDYNDLTFLSNPLYIKYTNESARNIVYTLLEAVLVCIIYQIYKTGIKNNSLYRKDKAITIGIGGDSGSGKSTLLLDIRQLFKNDLIELEGDGEHKWERGDSNWNNYTHLNPKANFLHKQLEVISNLKKLMPAIRKNYNHKTGKFDAPVKIEPKPYIVLSGLHPFYLPKMRKALDIKIYLNPNEELRKFWKISRDIKERGYTKEKVLESMQLREEDSNKYIKPQKEYADIIISYFPIDVDQLNNFDNSPNLGLKIELDSSIEVEDILERVSSEIDIFHDYSDNLKSQIITINKDIEIQWEKISYETIENLYEIVPFGLELNKGLRGFIQLIILKAISEKMKEKDDKSYIA